MLAQLAIDVQTTASNWLNFFKQKIYRKCVLKLNQHYIYLQSACQDMGKKTYYNYTGAKFYFLSKLSELRTVNRRKRKKERRETMTRRRIKSGFVCINCIQVLRLKNQK